MTTAIVVCSTFKNENERFRTDCTLLLGLQPKIDTHTHTDIHTLEITNNL